MTKPYLYLLSECKLRKKHILRHFISTTLQIFNFRCLALHEIQVMRQCSGQNENMQWQISIKLQDQAFLHFYLPETTFSTTGAINNSHITKYQINFVFVIFLDPFQISFLITTTGNEYKRGHIPTHLPTQLIFIHVS